MLVINGKRVAVPGVESACFLDDPKYGFTNREDYSTRSTSWVRSICVHTRLGKWPQTFEGGGTNRHWDEFGVKIASNDDRSASWHISTDADGSFVCHLDLVKHKAYHVGQCNDVSIGIEMYQSSDGVITTETLDTCVKLIDIITRELRIQRQFVAETTICQRFAHNEVKLKTKRNLSKKLAYIPGGRSGEDFVGIFGHRNATRNRGKGDPGDKIFELLEEAGYEKFYVDKEEDLNTWKVRQSRLGIKTPDGIPGPGTSKIIEAGKQAHGLWIPRPGDDGI